MISVLFTILKIIGITLLVVLALLLLVILAVLFVPVKYRVQGAYKDSVQVMGRVTFAFPLFCVKVLYEDSLQYTIRILGIPLRLKGKKDKPEKTSTKPESKKQYSGVNETLLADNNAQEKEEPVSPRIEDKEEAVETDNETIIEDKVKLTDKIKNIIEKLKSIFDKIKNIRSKIIDIKNNVDYYLDILNSDVGKKAIATCKERLIKLLKSICPKKGEVNITFGLDDPATMGKILGWHGILYAYIGNLIYLYPDFDNKCFACDFYVKGKIRFGTILYQVLRVITDKNCKQLLTLLKGRK